MTVSHHIILSQHTSPSHHCITPPHLHHIISHPTLTHSLTHRNSTESVMSSPRELTRRMLLLLFELSQGDGQARHVLNYAQDVDAWGKKGGITLGFHCTVQYNIVQHSTAHGRSGRAKQHRSLSNSEINHFSTIIAA